MLTKFMWKFATDQPIFISSKSTMKAPEQCVKYVQSYQYRHRNNANDVIVFILNFEQISQIAPVPPLFTLNK